MTRKLAPRITLVGSGALGDNITDPHDSHVYLVHGRDDAVLIDAGCGLATPQIAENVRAVLGPLPVSRILLTHAHPDHAAGSASLARELAATVCALPEARRLLLDGDEDGCGLKAARAAGTYPPHLRLEAVTDALALQEERLDVGEVSIDVIPTPGHAAGHASFLLTSAASTVLFSGDLVFAGGRVAVLDTPDTDLDQLAVSLRLVAALAPEAMLAGHGQHVLVDAPAHLGAAVQYLDRHEIPPGLLATNQGH